MRSFGWMLVIALLILIGVGYFLFTNNTQKGLPAAITTPPTLEPKATSTREQKIMPLSITSPAFEPNGTIPARFTCDGKNISPELIFNNIPKNTQSLALTMEDPDVPKSVRADGMWNHWVLWNMPPATIRLEEEKVPPGVIGVNTGGKMTYGGPCPPDREHRYIFTLYALDSELNLAAGSTKEELLRGLVSHIIEKAELVGRYDRNR